MKFRLPKECPVIYKLNGEPLSVTEFRYFYIDGPEKLNFDTIAALFEVKAENVYVFAKKNKVTVRKEDYHTMAPLEEKHKQSVKRWQAEFEEKMRQQDEELWKQAEQLYGKPKPEVDTIYIKGKPFRDTDLLDAYNREVAIIFNQLKHPPKLTTQKRLIRSVDLSAMRLHRGLDMYAFSQMSKIPYKTVVYYEKTREVVIPKEISDIYFKVLNISKTEFKKIIECLSGKRKDMHDEESRIIPDAVKNYVWNRDGGKCAECGRTEYLHFHHKDHYANGGKHQARNLKLLCVVCHAKEHYGEPGYGMLKAQAQKLLGVTI